MKGYLYRTIKRGSNLSPDPVKGLQTAGVESIRMRRLVDDYLLDLSRSDLGKLALNREQVQLVDQIEQMADLACHTLRRPLWWNSPMIHPAVTPWCWQPRPPAACVAGSDRKRRRVLPC